MNLHEILEDTVNKVEHYAQDYENVHSIAFGWIDGQPSGEISAPSPYGLLHPCAFSVSEGLVDTIAIMTPVRFKVEAEETATYTIRDREGVDGILVLALRPGHEVLPALIATTVLGERRIFERVDAVNVDARLLVGLALVDGILAQRVIPSMSPREADEMLQHMSGGGFTYRANESLQRSSSPAAPRS